MEKMIHLGDDYTDADEIGEREIIRVPGVFSDAYQDRRIENRRVENFGGWRFLLTHTLASHPNDLPGDLSPEEVISTGRVHVALFGHTHKHEILQKNSFLLLNPGDCSGWLSARSSVAIIDLPTLTPRIFFL